MAELKGMNRNALLVPFLALSACASAPKTIRPVTSVATTAPAQVSKPSVDSGLETTAATVKAPSEVEETMATGEKRMAPRREKREIQPTTWKFPAKNATNIAFDDNHLSFCTGGKGFRVDSANETVFSYPAACDDHDELPRDNTECAVPQMQKFILHRKSTKKDVLILGQDRRVELDGRVVDCDGFGRVLLIGTDKSLTYSSTSDEQSKMFDGPVKWVTSGAGWAAWTDGINVYTHQISIYWRDLK